MKTLLTSLILISIAANVHGQYVLPIDSIYGVIKQRNIHSKNANWASINNGFAEKLKSAKSDIDSIRSFLYVFEQLQDFHSAVMYKGNYITNYPQFDDSSSRYLGPLVNLSNQRTGKFTAIPLEEDYLYLQIPGVQAMGERVSLLAQMLADTLHKYLSDKTKGVVIDLRLNGGGQFSSMAAGIAPLLGDHFICGGINSDAVQVVRFTLKEGNVFINDYQLTSIQHKIKRNLENLPVALIIGPNTRSSGSILAIAFKARANTIFIGEHTANGYTTGNDFFQFGEGLFLNLSTTFSTDRMNRLYKDVVEPDIVVRGEDNFISIREDKKVKLALDWLKKNSR